MYYITNITGTITVAFKAKNKRQATTLLSNTFGRRTVWNVYTITKADYQTVMRTQDDLRVKGILMCSSYGLREEMQAILSSIE